MFKSKSNETSVEDRWAEVQELFADDEYEEALEEMRLLLAYDDTVPSFWSMEGRIRVALGEMQAAERAFERACAEAPGLTEPILHKAGFLNALERFDEAYLLAGQALQYTEDERERRDIFFLQAEARLGEARRELLVMMEELVEFHAESPDELEQMPEQFLPMTPEIEERLQEVLRLSQKALDFDKDFAEAWHLQANALMDLGRVEESVKALKKATTAAPFQSQLWYDFGMALEVYEDFEGARKAYKELYKLETSSTLDGMDFSRQEFAELAEQVWQDISAEAFEHLDVSFPSLEVITQDFPEEELLDEGEAPFNPWTPFRLEVTVEDEENQKLRFILYQRNIEREAETAEPSELYFFLRNVIEEILFNMPDHDHEPHQIEA